MLDLSVEPQAPYKVRNMPWRALGLSLSVSLRSRVSLKIVNTTTAITSQFDLARHTVITLIISRVTFFLSNPSSVVQFGSLRFAKQSHLEIYTKRLTLADTAWLLVLILYR